MAKTRVDLETSAGTASIVVDEARKSNRQVFAQPADDMYLQTSMTIAQLFNLRV